MMVLIDNNNTTRNKRLTRTTMISFVSVVCVLLLSVTASVDGASSLVQRWDIDERRFKHDDMNVYLHYVVNDQNDASTNIQYTIYDGPGCQPTGHKIDIEDKQSLQQSPFRSTGLQFNKQQSSSEAIVGIQIDPDTISGSAIYHERTNNPQEAKIVFCVRFSLFTDSGDGGIEVNFRETIIKLNVDLQGEFKLKLDDDVDEEEEDL